MAFVARGLTSKQIARELGISPSTVDNHVRAAVVQIGAASRFDAAQRIISAELARGGENYQSPEQPVSHLFQNQIVKRKSPRISLFGLPPLGGVRNELGSLTRFLHVAQIALLGTMVFAAITATIAGIVNLFHR